MRDLRLEHESFGQARGAGAGAGAGLRRGDALLVCECPACDPQVRAGGGKLAILVGIHRGVREDVGGWRGAVTLPTELVAQVECPHAIRCIRIGDPQLQRARVDDHGVDRAPIVDDAAVAARAGRVVGRPAIAKHPGQLPDVEERRPHEMGGPLGAGHRREHAARAIVLRIARERIRGEHVPDDRRLGLSLDDRLARRALDDEPAAGAIGDHQDGRAERGRALDDLDRLVECRRRLQHRAREVRHRPRRPRCAHVAGAYGMHHHGDSVGIDAGDHAELAGPADAGPRDPILRVRDGEDRQLGVAAVVEPGQGKRPSDPQARGCGLLRRDHGEAAGETMLLRLRRAR